MNSNGVRVPTSRQITRVLVLPTLLGVPLLCTISSKQVCTQYRDCRYTSHNDLVVIYYVFHRSLSLCVFCSNYFYGRLQESLDRDIEGILVTKV